MLEILLAIGLVALLGGLFIGATGSLLTTQPKTAEEVFWKAVVEARKYALLHNQDVRIGFDAKAKEFVASTVEGTRRFPVPVEGEIQLDFLRADVRGRSSVLIAGTLVETSPVPYVVFYADGTCMPFRVQLRTGSSSYVIEIDPWTCAPVLPPPAQNAST